MNLVSFWFGQLRSQLWYTSPWSQSWTTYPVPSSTNTEHTEWLPNELKYCLTACSTALCTMLGACQAPLCTLVMTEMWKKKLRRPRTAACRRVWAIQQNSALHQTHNLFQWVLYRSSYGTVASLTWTQDCRESISIPTLSFNYTGAKHSRLAPCPCLPKVPVASLSVCGQDRPHLLAHPSGKSPLQSEVSLTSAVWCAFHPD